MPLDANPPDFPFPAADGPDPSPLLDRMRAERPVGRVRLPSGDLAWLVTGYADNRRLLADPVFSRAAAAAVGAPRLRRIPLEAGSITGMDPPEHTRLRRLVARAFTMRTVERMRAGIEEIACGLLDELVAAGPPAELVTGFARPLAITVICALLGVPAPEHARFTAWTEAYLGAGEHTAEEMTAAADALRGYLSGLVADKRRAPGDDLLSALVTAREDDRLSERELVALGITLLVAGFETTANMIAGSVQTLLDRHGRLEPALAGPGARATAVDELLRYVAISASGATIRVAVQDTVLGGTLIRAGEAVLPATTSANRDGAVFTDADHLDLARTPNPHLAFGHGPHHCLGARLATVELDVAIAALLDRMPALRPAESGAPVRWRGGGMVRGPLALPVAW